MFERIIGALKAAQRVGIFTHVHPDGDAMGSAYVLKQALRSLGKEAEVFLLPDADAGALGLITGREETGLAVEDCQLLAAVDCGDSARLGDYEALFLAHGNTVAIDHHITHRPFGGVEVVEDLSSTCELMVELLREMEIPISREMAQNLYIGMASDTGSFRYAGVTPDTFRRAAEVLEAGADIPGIAKQLFDTKSAGYYRLLRRALERLTFYYGGRVCVLSLTEEDFAEAGVDESHAVAIVNIPSSVEGVQVGAYIRHRGPEEYKVSLRSAGGVDVAAIAAALGGGGHKRASGYTVLGGSVEALVATLLQALGEQFPGVEPEA